MGTDGPIHAQTTWDPDGPGPRPLMLVAAGDFATAGSIAAGRIAGWNGATWSALGDGLNGPVRAVAVHNGELIAAGEFTTAGGSPASSIARFNGTAWAPLGQGLDGPAYAVAVHNGDLYAGGGFVNAGGQPAVAIARWDGSAWHSVGGGANGPVYAVCSFGGSLYAGGAFSAVGGRLAANVASWNGSSWAALGSGVAYPAGTPSVRALAEYGGRLVVAGQFTQAGPVQTFSIASWDGSAWQPYGTGVWFQACAACSPSPTTVKSVAVFNGELVACPDPPPLMRWNGSAWSGITGVPDGFPIGTIESVAVFDGGLYTAGSYLAAGGAYANNIARWSGSAWTKLGGFDNEIDTFSVHAGRLVVGGDFNQARGQVAKSVASWNGSAWEQVGDTTGLGHVYRSVVVGSDLVVSSSTGVHRLDGNTWTRLGTAGIAEYLLALNGTLYGGADVFAASFFPNAVARWNGAAWEAVGSGVTRARSLVSLNNQLVASVEIAGTSMVAKWNGIIWQQLGPAFTGIPGQLAVNGTDLFAAWTAGSTTRVARFDGVSWTQVGASFNGSIRRLAVANGELFAAGAFTQVGATPASRIARFDGAAWVALGQGLNDAWVNDIFGVDGQVAVAGRFTMAGGRRFAFLGRWGCPPCYANCDGSTIPPILNVNDFLCFQNLYSAGDIRANCDGSTIVPVLNINDFVCFQTSFAQGCP